MNNKSADELDAKVVVRQSEYCEHGVDIVIANCHRCDGSAIYTEKDLQDEVRKARVDENERFDREIGLLPDDIQSYGGELYGKWSERKYRKSKISERLEALTKEEK